MTLSTKKVSFAAVICFAIALKCIISLYPYSGAENSPMYGDYEAQRHWQEVCVNLPPSEWYMNSSRNDLLYWGLDYPPLTAYHSWCLGKLAKRLNTSYVQLYESRGFESDEHKFFMRISVLIADVVIYIPAVLLLVTTINSLQRRKGSFSLELQHLAVCLFYPGQSLIDNGHFQYNNISLGLALLAVIGILKDRRIFASIVFSLALNYKQMELYHALPFFVYLLQSSFREASLGKGILKFIQIGASVVSTFSLMWLPWIGSWNSFIGVVQRIFPVNRGVFEDKVSNIWCTVNVVIKLKTIFKNESMAIICMLVTALMLLPSAIQLFRNPTKKTFLYGLFNSAITFFLFSFQVHEKSILLPALSAITLFPFEPFVMIWFLQISTFSMFPLLQKDQLTLPFVATCVIFQSFVHLLMTLEPMSNDGMLKRFKWLYWTSCVLSIVLILCHLFMPVPERLPHIYILAISVFSCIHFIAAFCYTNFKQVVS